MIELNDQQLDFLEKEISKSGLRYADLGASLLDHFACGIEREMQLGLGFYEAYHKVYMEISPNGMNEFDRSMTQVIIHQKYSPMKKTAFIIGFCTALMAVVGYIFKSQHWPSANMLILFGSMGFALLFLPMYFYLKFSADKELGKQKPVFNYLLNFLLIVVIISGFPYRILKWPGSAELILISEVLLAFVFFPKVFLGWYRKFSENPAAA